MLPAQLVLETGERFAGVSPVSQASQIFGEVVFNTGMVGYIECLTDPSYTGQILVFTYPMIGNYGVPPVAHWESPRLQAAAMVVAELSPFYCHPQASLGMAEFCEQQALPYITGVDTRALTKCLRNKGVVAGAIVIGEQIPQQFVDINQTDLVAKVTTRTVVEEGTQGPLVLVVDCGIKENILRHLRRFPLRLKRVPYDHDISREKYDGLFISNGPGDPARCEVTIANLRHALTQDKPIFGICLGAQLLALAAGATTYKLPFGHRAQNQPCFDVARERCVLTSQNHGFAIAAKSLPADWLVSYRNLNDDTIQGIKHKHKPFFAVQFHPEAAPGPIDTEGLFAEFYELIKG
jgi:carbamoyl-phosphate synthase small subunit